MNTEEQQRLWDMMLVQAWVCFANMNILCGQFIYQASLDSDEYPDQILSHLKRVPRNPRDISKPVRAFVAQRLPKLSKHLWDGRIPKKAMIDFLSNSSLDTSGVTIKRIAAHHRHKQYERDKTRALLTRRRLRREYEDQFNRMHDHVKETASAKNRH